MFLSVRLLLEEYLHPEFSSKNKISSLDYKTCYIFIKLIRFNCNRRSELYYRNQYSMILNNYSIMI